MGPHLRFPPVFSQIRISFSSPPVFILNLMQAPVGSMAELEVRLAGVEAALPAADGVACFNRMYRVVTASIEQHVTAGVFGDPEWMARLDLVFANLYLSALDPAGTPPRAWAALIERRSDSRVTSLQFALAGMNAHINHDLPLAVVMTSTQLGTSPDAGSHHADFEQVNSILAGVEPAIRQSFMDAVLQALDRTVPGLEDVVANFNMVNARETAWANAGTLRALNGASAGLSAAFLDGLDHLVGFAGRGLLVPLVFSPAPVFGPAPA
jgi:hypothetical protein